jgi:uncharacterized Zn finger protein
MGTSRSRGRRGRRATRRGNLRESGTASRLGEILSDLARRRRRWPLVAADAAERFFERPDVPGFHELVAAASKAGCEEGVRAEALRFLETGRHPRSGKWPLPETGLAATDDRSGSLTEKHWDVLRDLAIDEGRPDDVLAWHDRLVKGEGSGWRSGDGDQRVARAVSSTHPDRAIEMYTSAAERLIDRKHPDAYSSAGGILGHVRDLMLDAKRTR